MTETTTREYTPSQTDYGTRTLLGLLAWTGAIFASVPYLGVTTFPYLGIVSLAVAIALSFSIVRALVRRINRAPLSFPKAWRNDA